MTIFSRKTFAFAIAATIIGTGALTCSAASAGPLQPGVSPMPSKFNNQPSGGCPGGLVGCTPNTYTPGNSGGGQWHGGVGLTIAIGAPASSGDCFYVRRRIYTDIGVIVKRQLVCE